jgi:Fe-S-cluster containining protein
VADQNERDARDRAIIAGAARTGAVLTELAPGRSCGTCIMCCKVYAIRELNKRAGQMCVHAERGCGCKIYENRPDTCRSFYCMWRVDATLGPEWKPETARFVVALDLLYDALKITPDPGRPDAWKKEPYYSAIKGWARKFCPENKKVVVVDSRGSMIAVLPDREVPIGVVGTDEEIVIYRDGETYGVAVRPRVSVGAPAAETASGGQAIMASGAQK